MQVILKEDVPNLGDMGEIVTVAAGYGRNFLIPQGLALPATSSNARQLQHEIALIEQRKERQRQVALGVFSQINDVSVTIPMRVGEHDKLFGSVTTRDIAEALSQQSGHTIERKQVQLSSPITELGVYKVPVKLASGIRAQVRVWVVAM
jgi:large subunit ribosomal protein L9